MALQFDAGSARSSSSPRPHEWIPPFGVSYAVGVDGIALVLIALAAVLAPVVHARVVARRRATRPRRDAGFFALVLVLETMMIGVFAATDVFLFYVLLRGDARSRCTS